MKRPAVARQHQREIQLVQCVESSNPFIEETIPHVGKSRAFVLISCANNALLRQVDERVTAGVAAPQKQELDFPYPSVKCHLRGISRVRRSWLDLGQLPANVIGSRKIL